MGAVRVSQTFGATVHEAERCWLDTTTWPQWVDGLAEVVEVRGQWPYEGSQVMWESGPAGRGRVRELVVEYEPLAAVTLEVEDDSINAIQRVAFDPIAEGVQVHLSLDYRIKRRSPLTPLVDRLFVRRPMSLSLNKTLERFGAVLADSRHSRLG